MKTSFKLVARESVGKTPDLSAQVSGERGPASRWGGTVCPTGPYQDTLLASLLQLVAKELCDRSVTETELVSLREVTYRLQNLCTSESSNLQQGDVIAVPEVDELEIEVVVDEAGIHPINFLPWQQQLVNLFEEVDTDGSGSLGRNELRNALSEAGLPKARLVKLMRQADVDGSGEIELKEWIRVIRDGDSVLDELHILNQGLRPKSMGYSNMSCLGRRLAPFMLHPMSTTRIVWDLFVCALCIYVATLQIFTIAWSPDMDSTTVNTFSTVNLIMDCLFLTDVLLNFFTGYLNCDDELELDWTRVACRYTRTWLLLDLFSSLPLDNVQHTSQFKLLKVGKLAKALRVLKPQSFSIATYSQELDDFLNTFLVQMIIRRLGVVAVLCLLCHWLACGMKIIDEGFLSSYIGAGTHNLVWREYLSALYWAMTTLTTVGYGDITPTSDGERAYTIFAMVIGGGFYGYAVGSISSIVAASDMNASAYYERMDIIHAWIKHHRLPNHMQKIVIRYFKDFLSSRSAASETDLWNTLSPALQRDVGAYIVHDEVKHNFLFEGLAVNAVVRLQAVLRSVTIPVGQLITSTGEAGTAMYIIVAGLVDMQKDGNGNGPKYSHLGAGESFGEEIVLGLTDDYNYTTRAIEKSTLQQILEDDFLELFRNMPNMKERMRRNAIALHPEWKSEFEHDGGPTCRMCMKLSGEASTK